MFFACLFFGMSAVPCTASYYEDWLIEADILEIHDEKKTTEILRKNPEFEVEKHFVGLKIEIRECKPVEGHGRTKCRKGEEKTIILSFEDGAWKASIAKEKPLKIRYFYSNGADPTGGVVTSQFMEMGGP